VRRSCKQKWKAYNTVNHLHKSFICHRFLYVAKLYQISQQQRQPRSRTSDVFDVCAILNVCVCVLIYMCICTHTHTHTQIHKPRIIPSTRMQIVCKEYSVSVHQRNL
jgi:hypothetical protein